MLKATVPYVQSVIVPHTISILHLNTHSKG
jgi:hypothetical protein